VAKLFAAQFYAYISDSMLVTIIDRNSEIYTTFTTPRKKQTKSRSAGTENAAEPI
jgi:hypothetical protein